MSEVQLIRYVLMDRLISLDTEMRAAGQLGLGENPPLLPVSATEEAALRDTCSPCEGPLQFYGVPLWIESGGA